MEDFVSIFSSNPIVLAVANLAAIAAALWALIRALQFIFKFSQTAIRKNLRQALRNQKNKSIRLAITCSIDAYVYISYLVIRSGLFFGLLVNLFLIRSLNRKYKEEFRAFPPTLSFENYQSYLSFGHKINSILTYSGAVILIIIFVLGFQVLNIAQNVWRIRVRWHARGHLREVI